MYAAEGRFGSPGYPESNYPNNMRCIIKIEAPMTVDIHVKLKFLDIEEDDGYCYDELRVSKCNFTIVS